MGQDCFKKALKLSNLYFELVGVYGKRTKYQQKDLAQLFLKITDSNDEFSDVAFDQFTKWEYSNKDLDLSQLPKDMALNDDTLLNKVKISNPKDEEDLSSSCKMISQLEQVVLFCSL